MKKGLLFLFITVSCMQGALAMELTSQELNAQLVKAAIEGNRQEVEKLFDMGADAKLFPYTSFPDVANLEILRLLIAHGADINAMCGTLYSQDTALITALNHHSSEKCKMLLDAGANPNLFVNRHPLIHAIENTRRNFNHSYRALKMLLSAGADINACRGRHGNAFVYAARTNKLLCELWIRDQKNVNTLMLCLNRMANNGDVCAKLLLKKPAALLLPYLDIRKYMPLTRLLNAKDDKGMRAFDYYQVDWLNPDLPKVPKSPYSDPSLADWVALSHSYDDSSGCSIQ